MQLDLNLREQIHSVMVDQQEELKSIPEKDLDRSSAFQSIPGKALILTGVRRCGKSRILQQIARTFNNPLVFSFFDERLFELQASNLNLLLEVHAELSSGRAPDAIFLDEIQLVEGWELFVTRLVAVKKWQVFITGSSAHLLGQEIATSMRGRGLRFEIFPFSLAEQLGYFNINIARKTTSIKGRIRAQVLNYIYWGSFPETLELNSSLKRHLLSEYWETMLFKDIVERHDFKKVDLARVLLNQLAIQYASPFTINKLFNRLKSLGYSLEKSVLSEFLRWCEDAYVLFAVSIYSDSPLEKQRNYKKIYLIDNGFAQLLEARPDANRGRRLENLVFQKLRANFTRDKINYYRTENGNEVDFIVSTLEHKRMLIQVTWDIEGPETLNRETRALIEASNESGITDLLFVSFENMGHLRSQFPRIQFFGIEDFLLSDIGQGISK